MRTRRLLPMILFAAATSSSFAQHSGTGSAHAFAAPRAASQPNLTSALPMGSPPFAGFPALGQMRGGHHSSSALPFGLESFLTDFSLPTETLSAPTQSPINLMEALAALNKTPEPAPPASQPLLIELKGDHYVRVANVEMSEGLRDIPTQDGKVLSRNRRVTTATKQLNKSQNTTTNASAELAPVVLVFRDGHSEDIRDYSIVAGVIYARGDYYTDGYWNKKIELSALNLPETFKTNQSRGVKFVLPNAPNEVITRP